jgi:hypothetical protein
MHRALVEGIKIGKILFHPSGVSFCRIFIRFLEKGMVSSVFFFTVCGVVPVGCETKWVLHFEACSSSLHACEMYD